MGNALSGSLEVRAVRWRGPFNGLFDARVGDVAREVGREGALERDGVPGSDTCETKNEFLRRLHSDLSGHTTFTSSSSLSSRSSMCVAARALSSESRVCVRRTSCSRLIAGMCTREVWMSCLRERGRWKSEEVRSTKHRPRFCKAPWGRRPGGMMSPRRPDL